MGGLRQFYWSAVLAQESSTTREILAVRKVLQSFAPNLAGLCQMASDGLRSVGGLQVASGWHMQTPLGLFVLASEWLA